MSNISIESGTVEREWVLKPAHELHEDLDTVHFGQPVTFEDKGTELGIIFITHRGLQYWQGSPYTEFAVWKDTL